MIESIIEKSVKNKALLLLTLLIAAFLSFWAIRQTPLDALPDLTPPQVIVNVKYLGQSPKIIQDQLVYELTNALLSVAKTKTVRGFTSYENAIVYIIFEDGTLIPGAMSLEAIEQQLQKSHDKVVNNAK